MSEIFPEKPIPSPVCRVCGLTPVDCEIDDLAQENGMTEDEYIVCEDGTYDRETHTFICDADYVATQIPLDHWAIKALRSLDAHEGGE